jgi:divalent metal cation (Fe/Co/Zn/Cd) transporter
VDPAITVSQAHALVEDLEGDIRGMLPDAVVTVHVDPDEPLPGDGASADPAAHHALHLHRH